ncbi:hypothetical protein [Nocardia miyunensis]|uniref:hypothetical protein n=1 Tax=Nocardia miyunensis TaxID=282684 RepID=UPI0008341C21|nr:hypothetical protein [Nocardia miyunensis]
MFGALVALLVASGWYVLVTLWWPASSRPYLAGSTDNNFMNLVLGYNGFARVLGRDGGGHAPTAARDATAHMSSGHPGFGGPGGQVRGVERLFSGEFGFEIGWLLPAALLAFVLVLVSRGRAPRTDLTRAAAIVFGGWMIIDGAVFSYMNGMVHPYYCLSIAPAVAGMFAIGIREMWIRRETIFGRLGLAALLTVTGVWSFVLLHRNSGWYPELRWGILIVTILAAVLVAVSWTHRTRRGLAAAALTVGVLGGLSGPAAYSVATVATSHTGGGPTVGPAEADAHFGWGQTQASPELTALLQKTNSTWAAAVNGSSSAAGLELQSGKAVMAIGGFSGSDPTPSLAQFQADVKAGKIGYYVVEANGRGQGGGRTADSRSDLSGTADARAQRTGDPSQMSGGSGGFGRNQHTDITDWVTATFIPQQVGTATVYDLSGYQG